MLFRSVAHPAEKYYRNTLSGRERLAETDSLFAHDLGCLQPRWVVHWEHEMPYLAPFGEFLAHFPGNDPRMSIRLADAYESRSVYLGKMWIYRVEVDGQYVSSLAGSCGD